MRVLCLDPSGLLGGLPSPVLLPDYNEHFFLLTAIGGDSNDDTVADFLHAGSSYNVREVWVLWHEGSDSNQIEPQITKLLDRLTDWGHIPVWNVLVENVASGMQTGQFFDSTRRVSQLALCAEMKHIPSNWKTVLLGIQVGHGLNPSELKISVALALRFWMTREQTASRWPESAYRLLFSFEDQDAKKLLLQECMTSLRSRWQEIFSQLRSRIQEEQDRCCDSVFFNPPHMLLVKLEAIPTCWPALHNWFGIDNKHLSVIYRSEDPTIIRDWINTIFGHLLTAIGQAVKTADESFREESRKLFNNDQALVQTRNETPWQAVAKFEAELQQLEMHQPAGSAAEALTDELARYQRRWMITLFDSIRQRPTRKMVTGCSAVCLLIAFALAAFNETLVVPAPALPGWIWYVGSFLMVSLSTIWGLFRAQFLVRDHERTIISELKSRWDQALKAHNEYLDGLQDALKRIVATKNLEIARREMDQRNQRVAQMDYHINRLGAYQQSFGGGIIAESRTAERTNPFNLTSAENENPAYHWNGPGVEVLVRGRYGDHLPLNINLKDPRLAGVYSIEVQCVYPNGRSVPIFEG